jgi:ribonucleoside-diphosphate reductase alpha chain
VTDEPESTERIMSQERSGITHKVEIYPKNAPGKVEGYITANLALDGKMREVFLAGFGKEGSTLDGWTQFSAICLSLALQGGEVFNDLALRVAQMKFEPFGQTNNPQIPWAPSVPAYIMAWLALRFGNAKLQSEMHKVMKEWR